MRRAFLALSCLALVLLGVLIVGASLGLADGRLFAQSGRPTPTPDRVFPAAAPNSPDIPSLPDLVVESIEVAPSEPLIDEPVIIRVTIKNQGTSEVPLVPEPKNFWTDLYVDPAVVPIQLGQDGELEWGCQAWWMSVGGSWTIQGAFVFTDVKSYALYAQVDTDNHVAESNENNNVFGPVNIEVKARNNLVHESHLDFQMGLASNLDVTHPDGVLRRGVWMEPFTEPEVYSPDAMINDVTGTFDVNGEFVSTKAYQASPALTGNGMGSFYAVWEDSRSGYYHRDVMFSRSDDGGATWSPDITITEGITGMQVSPDLAYDSDSGRLYAVWQDGRNGSDDFDVYFAYSDDEGDTWSVSQKVNDDKSTSQQTNPSIALGPSAPGQDRRVYVIWQDRKNHNDDVYLSRSDDLGATWSGNYLVTDHPVWTSQDQRFPTIGISGIVSGTESVFVCWEDRRWEQQLEGYTPEVYCSASADQGETFGLDVPMDTWNLANVGKAYRVEPSVAVATYFEIKEVEELSNGVPISVPVQMQFTVVHVGFQQGNGDDADIFWGYAVINHTEGYECPEPYPFCFEEPIEVSGAVINSQYALPPDTGPTWPIDGTRQGQVSLSLAPPGDWTYCHIDSKDIYSNGLYFAWSDSRTYDDWRYEIRTRRAASRGGDPESFDICEDIRGSAIAGDILPIWDIGVVNDDAKLYAYRNDLDLYEIYQPAATGQRNPSLYVDESGMYVAWDDDRWDKPMEPGTVRNRDVFFAGSGAPPEGIYISPVIDSGTRATWYALSWWGVTDFGEDLLLQTRLGDDAYPPQADITTTNWTKWTGNPSSPYLGCDAGVGCYYDAPGRHIVGPDGQDWPESRYIQYKVIIQGTGSRTALSRVTIHYKGVYVIYAPVVMKDY